MEEDFDPKVPACYQLLPAWGTIQMRTGFCLTV